MTADYHDPPPRRSASSTIPPTMQARWHRVPHRCPVCQGVGRVPAGFYSLGDVATSTAPETCRACDGGGVLWGSESLEETQENQA